MFWRAESLRTRLIEVAELFDDVGGAMDDTLDPRDGAPGNDPRAN
jgi:hypothetical protein